MRHHRGIQGYFDNPCLIMVSRLSMNQSYNEMAIDTEKRRPPRPPRSGTQQQKKSIFRSTAINLTALLLLFTLVFVLQGWGKWIGIHDDDSHKQTQATQTDSKAADKKNTVSTPSAKTEKSTPESNAVAKSKSSVYTLEEQPKAKQEPEKKKIITKKRAKKEYRARRVRIAPSDPYAQDKKMRVEEFDNDLARQRYRDENQRLSGVIAGDTVAETRYQPSHTYEYSATPSYPSNANVSVHDLDDEAARQHYNAENRRLSDSDTNLE